MYHNQIMHYKPCFNLFIPHNYLFDNQGSEINKDNIFCTFQHNVIYIYIFIYIYIYIYLYIYLYIYIIYITYIYIIHIYTVDICYLEYPLSRTFTMSNFLFGPFSILRNFPYKFIRYLELCYLELSLCRTIFSVPSIIFGLFPIRYLEHSNEVFE